MNVRGFFLSVLVLGGIVLGGMSSASPVRAQTISGEYTDIQNQGIIFANICTGDYTTACECRDKGKCTVRDILQVVVNVSYFVFGISGSAALIALIYGGISWITAAGNHDGIDRGKKAIAGAFIGLVIIFGAYAAINLILSILKSGSPATGTIESTVGGSASSVIQSQ